MRRLAVAFVVPAAVPAVASASPIEMTTIGPPDVGADATVSSSAGDSGANCFSLRTRD
jgi:hypothetical protein